MTLPINSNLVNPNRATGIFPGQSVFQVSSQSNPRGGLLDARESFVGIINNILSQSPTSIDNAAGVATLSRSQTINQNLIWFRIDYSYGIEYPLPYQWQSGNGNFYHVFNSTERNNLFYNPEIISAIEANQIVRVFVDSTNSNNPAWSIWEVNLTAANSLIESTTISSQIGELLVEKADEVFSVALAYNILVESYGNSSETNMISLTNLTNNDLIYISSDETADSFWTIYKYNDINLQPYTFTTANTFESYSLMIDTSEIYSFSNGEYFYVIEDENNIPSPYSSSSNVAFWAIYQYNSSNSSFNLITSKFIIVQAQAYRTTDFYSTIDWYAQNFTISNVVVSYSANVYPMITYASVTARTLGEGTNPTNTFVEINDGVNPWYWTAYDNVSQQWITVAVENGTIALSENFYSTSTVIFNPAEPVITNISNRDGSWEIRVLTDILYYDGLLTDLEINETFFSLLHFIHVQQTNIDWAFKTNFMTVAGYQIPLIQTGIETTDISSSLESYIEEVKPYRVKIRNYEQQYSPDIDNVYTHVTDFDKPVYYDAVLKKYRRLDPNNSADLEIMATTLPWQDWYEQLNFQTISANFIGDGITYTFAVGAAGNIDSVTINGTTSTNYISYVSASLNITSVEFYSPPTISSQILITVSLFSTYNQAISGISNITATFTADGTTNSFPVGATGTINSVMIDDVAATNYTTFVAAGITTFMFDTIIPNGDVLQINMNVVDGIYEPSTNQIRKLNTTILFDRVTGYQTEFGGEYGSNYNEFDAYDGTALDRILNFYVPLPGMTPADPSVLMNLDFKGTRTDGGLMTQFTDAASDFDNTETGFDSVGFDVQVNSGLNQIVDGGTLPGPTSENYQLELNPITSKSPLGYGLRDPYVAPQNPEERVPIVSDDVIKFLNTSQAIPGAATQTTKFFDVSSIDEDYITLFYDDFALDSNSILVWRDGSRLTQDQYTVDYFGRTVTPYLINSNATKASSIIVKIFGIGGSNAILETDYYDGNGSNTFEIKTVSTIQNQLLVSVNGFLYYPLDLSITGNSITLPVTTQTSDDVAIYVFESDSTDYNNFVQQETLPYNSNQSWTIQYPDNQSIPSHVGTIVEVNGERLLPPLTYYGPFDETRRYLNFDVTIQNGTEIDVYVNNIYYAYSIPTVTAGTTDLPFGVVVPSGQMPDNSDGMFAIYNQQLISLDPTFMTDEVCLVIHQGNDYEILDGVLTISKTLQSTDTIIVTTFSNSSIMSIRTHTFLTNNTGEYQVYSPYDYNYSWITLNGGILAGNSDYSFSNIVQTYNDFGFGPTASEINVLATKYTNLTIQKEYNLVANQWIIATVFAGQPAREQISWTATTSSPAALRMVPIPDSGGFGNQPFGVVGYDQKINWTLTIPEYNKTYDVFENPVPVPLYEMNDNSWEFIRNDDLNNGSLSVQLNPNDTSITISLLDANYSSKLAPLNPFYVPIQPPSALVGTFIGDGTTTTFTVSEIGTITTLVDGTVIPFGTDYTISISSTSSTATTTVVFATAPILNANITINVTKIAVQVPGVVYIGGERIEYYNLTQTGSTIVLNDIRRATRGTSSCCEQRYVETFTTNSAGTYTFNYIGEIDMYKTITASSNTFIGNGTTVAFSVYNVIFESISAIDALVDGTMTTAFTVSSPNPTEFILTFETAPLTNANITINLSYNIWMIENQDFTVSTTSNTTSIMFTPEIIDTPITIGFALGNYVPVGTIVRNATQIFNTPVPYDKTSGNRDIEPIRYLIKG